MKEDAYGAWPASEDELVTYIRSLTDAQHDYNTSADAMWKAAVAAFNYDGSTLGCTGFQASVAGMMFLKTTRGMRGPFAVVDGEKLLYPQYDLRAELERWLAQWPRELAPLARERLASDAGPPISPDVRARWEAIAALEDGDA